MAALCEFPSFLQPPGRKSCLCEGRCARYFASRQELALPMLRASWSPAKLQRKLYSCMSKDVEPQPRFSAQLGFGLVLTTATGPLHWCWLVPGQAGVQAGSEPLSACQVPCRHTLPHPRFQFLRRFIFVEVSMIKC